LIGLYQKVLFHATNKKEKQDILSALGKNNKVKIAPNLPKIRFEQPIEYIDKKPGEIKLISLARISPEKNFEQLFKLLRQQTGNITLDLYGTKDNQNYWLICEKLINSMPTNITINYCGVIDPIFIEETIKKVHFMISLTLGENFGHVILESFMANRPIIISDQTPWKNLKDKNVGWDLDLNNNIIINDTINDAINMGQEEFNTMVNSCNSFAQSILDDKESVQHSMNLFNFND